MKMNCYQDHRITPFGFLFALVIGVFSPVHASGQLRVVTTLPDFAQLAEELGGDRVVAEALFQGTEDAHVVEPKPSHILRLNRADLLVFIGLELEIGWLPPLVNQSRNSSIQKGSLGYFDASAYIMPKEVPVAVDRTMGDIHPGGNPHYYTSPLEMKLVAEALSARLMKLDPNGKAVYEERLEQFRTKYAQKLREWETAAAPLRGIQVVQYHKSWAYLLDWLGMEAIGDLEPRPGIPPSASHVSQLAKSVQDKDVQFVLQTVYESRRLSRVFSKKVGAELLLLPSMVGSYPNVKTIWDKWDMMIAMLTGKG